MVFITSHISGYRRIFIVRPNVLLEMAEEVPNISNNSKKIIDYEDILATINQKEGCCKDIFLACEGRPISSEDKFSGNENIVATLQLKGGKGGFGSMLRAIGAQIEKTTNREACRDLSGRRLRDINEEKRLKEFLSKKVEKEKEMLELKRKKLEQMKEGPKHVFEDKAYFEQREKREKDVFDSLDKAFSSSAGGSNGPSAKQNTCQRKARTMMIGDLDESSSEESEEEEGSVKGKEEHCISSDRETPEHNNLEKKEENSEKSQCTKGGKRKKSISSGDEQSSSEGSENELKKRKSS